MDSIQGIQGAERVGGEEGRDYGRFFFFFFFLWWEGGGRVGRMINNLGGTGHLSEDGIRRPWLFAREETRAVEGGPEGVQEVAI